MPAASRLRFERLSRRFGRLSVLRDLSGAAEAGRPLLVTGPNGSGKSTLLRCLAGLLVPDAGSIELDFGGAGGAGGERSIDDARARRAAAGYLAPDLAFYDELTVGENLAFFAGLRRTDPKPALAFAEELRLPLDRTAAVLSSGMRQRLRWAWLELGAPRLLLLDEPFQNLDPAGVEAVSARLARRIADGAVVVLANPSRNELLAGRALAEGADELRLAG
jgi:ABC-type multidrug transport system ATPase subunit